MPPTPSIQTNESSAGSKTIYYDIMIIILLLL